MNSETKKFLFRISILLISIIFCAVVMGIHKDDFNNNNVNVTINVSERFYTTGVIPNFVITDNNTAYRIETGSDCFMKLQPGHNYTVELHQDPAAISSFLSDIIYNGTIIKVTAKDGISL